MAFHQGLNFLVILRELTGDRVDKRAAPLTSATSEDWRTRDEARNKAGQRSADVLSSRRAMNITLF